MMRLIGKTSLLQNYSSLSCKGSIVFELSFQGNVVTVNVLVTDSITKDILISWYDLKALRVLPHDFPNVLGPQTPSKNA